MKDKTKILSADSGFTLIELIVVISIMVLLAASLILNLNSQRSKRNVTLAENELVAHLREAQSYTLSARLLPTGQTPQYYILKFDQAHPTQYTLQAIYNVNSSPQLMDISTINMPNGIRLASGTPISITQRLASPSSQSVPGSSDCALVIFAAPFGKTFFNTGCSPTSFTSPHTVVSGEDYQKILNFVANISCPTDPSECTLSTGSVMTITLSDNTDSVEKTVTINGITGAVTFN